jgi:hypothetical protein
MVFLLIGLMSLLVGLYTTLYGGYYRGYPLPRTGGVLLMIFGVLQLFQGFRKKDR